MLKRIVSLVLTLVLAFGMIPWQAKPVEAATTLSLQQLMDKFPAGKYWNHENEGRKNNNPDGWTDTPCSCHGRGYCVNDDKGDCRCNSFDGGVQCYGFAFKLAYDAYGSYASGWPDGTMSTLKAGDVIRYKNNGHSIWVTAVNGNTITYADCNYEATGEMCVIRWNNTITKDKVNQTLTWIKSAPYELNNSYEIDTRYPTPFKAYTLSSGNTKCYDSVNGNSAGEIYPTDECTIEEVYTNGWCRVNCPWTNSAGYKIVYVPVSVFNYTLNTFGSRTPADLGTNFTAPILNLGHWKIIENSYMEGDKPAVRTANETGYANQLWYFVRQSDGSYTISSCYDGKYLDVRDASTEMGTVVQTCVATGDKAQKWFIYEESGGYIFRSALNEFVLDLVNNDPTNGNTLQTYEWNATGAQIWQIYRGEECVMTGPQLSAVVQNDTNVKFTWNNVYGESRYDVKIWKDTYWNGDPVHVEWGASSGWEIQLPTGTYQAYVDASNYYDCKMSNVVTFTVQGAIYAISYDANGGTNAPSAQIKNSTVALTLSSLVPTGNTYTVTFDANGGMPDIDSKQVSQSFAQWNTEADGSGTSYAPGDIYAVDAPATLYAQWSNATLGSVDDAQRDGYYFLGWYDSGAVDSEGKPIGNEYTSSSIIDQDITLYALWTPADTLYFGDVNADGEVTFSDTLAINLYISGKYTPEYDIEEFFLRADLNRDGQITASDTDVGSSLLLNEITQEKLMASCVEASISPEIQTGYLYGEALNDSNLALVIRFAEGASYSITEGLLVHGFDPYQIGKQTIEVSFYQFEAEYQVEVACTHENKVCIPAKEADCENSGNNQYYVCNICNEILKADGKTKTTVEEEIVAATGHGYTSVVTEPTCTEQGYTTYTCAACGDSYVDRYVNALGHTEVVDKAVAPTCTRTGLTEGKHCSVCAEVLIAQTVVDALGHSYTAKVTAPTCTAQGYTTHICSACGNSYKDTYTNATGHIYSYKATKTPTASVTGTLTGTCSKCSGTTTVTLPKLNTTDYSYTVTKAATCTAAGTGRYTWKTATYGSFYFDVSIAKLGHSYTAKVTAPTCTEQGYTTYSCTCGDTYQADYVEALGHTEVVDKAVAPTCTEPGLMEGKHCSVCGTVLVAQKEVAALGHAEVTDRAVAATCTTEGLTAGKHCDRCGTVTLAQQPVPALGHTEVMDKAVDATCTETGLTEGKHCSVCGEVLVAQQTVPALGHDYKSTVVAPGAETQGYTEHTCTRCGDTYRDSYVNPTGHDTHLVNTKEATCTENGYTGDWVCKDCGKVVEQGSVIPAKGHIEAIDKAVAPTCTETGLTEGKHCSVCSEILVAQQTVDAKGHSYGNWYLTKMPTCTEAGQLSADCSVCGSSQTQAVSAIGHSEVTDQAVEPTCTETGLTEGKHCSVCGEVLVAQQTVAALGHSWDDGRITTAPTEDTEGVRTYTCSQCTQTRTETIPVLDHVHRHTTAVTPPTCTEQGYTTYSCNCGDTYRADYVEALGHTEVVDKAVAPTCTEPGLTEGKHCSVCAEVLLGQEVVSAKGHQYEIEVILPTCTERGHADAYCACGDRFIKWYIDPTGHSWGSWEESKSPNALEDGELSRTCSYCDAIETQPIENNPFVDVAESKYYYNAVMWAYYDGITTGKTATEFLPDTGCTRGQVVTFLWRAAGKPEPTSTENPFSDLDTSKFYYKAVLWAVEKGITNGYKDGTFQPDRTCSRAEIVTFLYRYAGNPPVEDAPQVDYTDVQPGKYYYNAVVWANANEVVFGYNDGTFRPGDTCTRAQIVAFLYRYLGDES